MEWPPFSSENIQEQGNATVNPDELSYFVSLSIAQASLPTQGIWADHYQIKDPTEEPYSIIIHPPLNPENSNGIHSAARKPCLSSYPSTILDRGNSERLRDEIKPKDVPKSTELLEPVRDTIAGVGSWSNNKSKSKKLDMGRRLRDAIIRSADDKKFLPLDKLKAIVTQEAVQDELDRENEFMLQGPVSAEVICEQREFQENNRTQFTSYQKIFAILVLIDQVKLISDFLHEGISDSHLPLKERRSGNNTFLVARDVQQDPEGQYRLQTSRGEWAPGQMEFFQNQQWIVCAPFFATAEHLKDRVHLYSLGAQDVLPFINGTDDEGHPAYLYQGFFSTVRRVKIHPAHHNFPIHADLDENRADFVVKEITRAWDKDDEQSTPEDYKRSFNQEVLALKRFCQQNERYIIKLLATYEINNRYHLLFPAADGNLTSHWKEYPKPEGPSSALWLMQECLGIARALRKIHDTPPHDGVSSAEPSQIRRHGIHGDIKPQNILWFKRLPGHLRGDTVGTPPDPLSHFGYLQLSDFGTVKFHRYMTRKGNEIQVQGNTYRAPESDLAGKQGSPAIDVWAFGCLYLDMITWYLLGDKSVEDDFPMVRGADEPTSIEGFTGEDKFFITRTHLFSNRQFQIVKPSVSEWIIRLRREPRCSQFIHDFLDLVQTRLLIVSLEERCQCSELVDALQILHENCEKNEEYYTVGRPHTWLSLESNCVLLKAKTRQLGQSIDSHGQALFLASLVIVVLYFTVPSLVRVFQEELTNEVTLAPL
ncbi:kinase-like protein [Hypoxylon sp. NC1633]|nr:kinase-like protein [Hypoxylon sp. NC1633]